MPNLGSYCFKPKYGSEISKKIIEHFCNKFLSYDHEGFYLHWREHDPKTAYKPVPKGWLEFYIDTDNGNMEAFTETCFWEDEANVDGRDLTEYFFAMLGEDFWGADVDGNLHYSMYERELFEVVQAISDSCRAVQGFKEKGRVTPVPITMEWGSLANWLLP
jgi:hypothetical protein